MHKTLPVFLPFVLALCLALPINAQPPGGGPEITYTVKVTPESFGPGDMIEAAFAFNLSEGWHTNAHEPLDEFLIPTALTFPESGAYAVSETMYPEAKLLAFDFNPNDKLAVYESEFIITARITLAAGQPLPAEITGQLRFQACNDQMCAAPKNVPVTIPLGGVAADTAAEPPSAETPDAATPESPEAGPGGAQDWETLADQFNIAGTGGYANKQDFLDFIARAESGEGITEQGFAGRSWGFVIAAVLLGGLLLNLTPCVLPLVPINIAIIGAGARAGSRARGFALGAVYGLGIAFVYGLLGLAVVLGLSTAFGTINATVWFNAGIAVLFVVLGLAMFDIIQIDFTRFQAKFGIRKNENGSFPIAFAMGCISALLAGACVAPVVIYTIVYAQDLYSQGTRIALFLPFLLGAGMALPWPFAGAGLSFLPKPGKWMVRVKQAFGVFILLFAAYYGHEAYNLARVHTAPAATESEGDWNPHFEAGLAQALEENKPVLVDFWATWCKNCFVMDKTVLKDDEVLEALDGYVKIKFQAEDMEAEPARSILKRYGVVGLPAYVILQPKTDTEDGAES